jgi:hypothetical protein
MNRNLLAAALVAVMVYLAGPALITATTGRPMFMDCQGLTTGTCEEALSHWSDEFESQGSFGLIVAFRYESAGGITCGDVEVNYWALLPPIPPFGDFAQPFCQ